MKDHKDELQTILNSKFEKYVIILMIIVSIFVYLQFFQLTDNTDELEGLVELFVQVNITAALAIVALVASIGTFRWDHYIKALKGEGMNQPIQRRIYILLNAKKPLYRVLILNSIFIFASVLLLFTGKLIEKETICLVFYTIRSGSFWIWVTIILIGLNLTLLIWIMHFSLKYMKELLFR